MRSRIAMLSSSAVVVLGAVVLSAAPSRQRPSHTNEVRPLATPAAGGPTQLVTSREDRRDPGERAAELDAPRGACERLQNHIDGLVAAAIPRSERPDHDDTLVERGDAFLAMCREQPLDEATRVCLTRSRSIEGIAACSAELLPPRQREVHARLVESFESGALSGDPAVVLRTVSEDMNLDARTTKQIEELMREHLED